MNVAFDKFFGLFFYRDAIMRIGISVQRSFHIYDTLRNKNAVSFCGAAFFL